MPEESNWLPPAGKIEQGCWKSEAELDSSIWWASRSSALTWPDPPLPLLLLHCLFIGCPCIGLSDGEVLRALESGVSGSWWDVNDSSWDKHLKSPLVAPWSPAAAAAAAAGLSWRGDSEVGAGVEGSVFSSESRPPEHDTRPGAPATQGVSESTPLSRCCSSMIFLRYLPWASILSWSCLWTCQTFTRLKLSYLTSQISVQ